MFTFECVCRERGKVKWVSQSRGKQYRFVVCHNVEEIAVIVPKYWWSLDCCGVYVVKM